MFRLTLTHEERLQFALCAKDTPGHIALGHLLQCDMDALDDGIPVLADGPWYARCDVLIHIPHEAAVDILRNGFDTALPTSVRAKLDALWTNLQSEI